MRALCEECGRAQPPDWRAGDLCSFCGKAVRHEARCYWCSKWIPAAKFCRSCGAQVVEDRLYGAARMLKDAGTDRFTIPKQLVEFDPDQIESFSLIYQRHAIAVARHVDELRFLERFLRHKDFSVELEDALVPELPWDEETLARMSGSPLPPGDDLATVRAIEAQTPVGLTSELARVARLRLGDWDAFAAVGELLFSSDSRLRAEAALALSGWRVTHRCGHSRRLREALVAELEQSAFAVEAAVGLGLVGRLDPDRLREALASSDTEIAFGAALVLGDVDRLQAAMHGDELQKIAAGQKLVELGILAPVVEVVEKSPLEMQHAIVDSLLERKAAAPEAASVLLDIVEHTEDQALRERAARILCRELRPEWVVRIARAARGDRSIFHSLLLAEGLDPAAAVALGDLLVAGGHFSTSQYGLDRLARQGIMPDSFVPSRFAGVDPETQEQLLRFAEEQLEQRQDEALHRFVLGVVFGAHPARLRAAAWWVLRRWYQHLGDRRGEGPLALERAAIERFFGSVAAFVPRLAAVLRDAETMKEVGYYEMIANLLGSADEATASAMRAAPAASELVEALLEVIRGDYWPTTREAAIRLLAQLGVDSRFCARALDGLRAVGMAGNYHYDKALRTLELSTFGIPEEAAWSSLPLEFVPSRFGTADAAARRELLGVVEHQLIHRQTEGPDPGLLRLLLETALTPGDAEVRSRAMAIFDERARDNRFALRPEAIRHLFATPADLVALLPAALTDPATLADERISSFLAALFGRPEPKDAAWLAEVGDVGHALVAAMLELIGAGGRAETGGRLARDLLRYLEHAGVPAQWRAEVVAALEQISAAPGAPLGSECDRLLGELRPPPADPVGSTPAARTGSNGPGTPAPPADNPWLVKQRIVEELGQSLQRRVAELMAGPGSPAEKMREAERLNQEFQAKIKALYPG